MERCPSCDFPVQDEWNELPALWRAPFARAARAVAPATDRGARHGSRTAARPVVTGPPPAIHAPSSLTAPMHDTMIPHRAGEPDAADGAPARKSGDTLIPRLAVRRPATIAALVGAGIAAVRLAGRRHRRH